MNQPLLYSQREYKMLKQPYAQSLIVSEGVAAYGRITGENMIAVVIYLMKK
jgi:hypothetical protein